MVRTTECHHLASVRTHTLRQKTLSHRLSRRIAIAGIFTAITVVSRCIFVPTSPLQCLKLVAVASKRCYCVAIDPIGVEVYIMDVPKARASHSAPAHSVTTVISIIITIVGVIDQTNGPISAISCQAKSIKPLLHQKLTTSRQIGAHTLAEQSQRRQRFGIPRQNHIHEQTVIVSSTFLGRRSGFITTQHQDWVEFHPTHELRIRALLLVLDPGSRMTKQQQYRAQAPRVHGIVKRRVLAFHVGGKEQAFHMTRPIMIAWVRPLFLRICTASSSDTATKLCIGPINLRRPLQQRMGHAQLLRRHIGRSRAADRCQLVQEVPARPRTSYGQVVRQQLEQLVACIEVL